MLASSIEQLQYNKHLGIWATRVAHHVPDHRDSHHGSSVVCVSRAAIQSYLPSSPTSRKCRSWAAPWDLAYLRLGVHITDHCIVDIAYVVTYNCRTIKLGTRDDDNIILKYTFPPQFFSNRVWLSNYRVHKCDPTVALSSGHIAAWPTRIRHIDVPDSTHVARKYEETAQPPRTFEPLTKNWQHNLYWLSHSMPKLTETPSPAIFPVYIYRQIGSQSLEGHTYLVHACIIQIPTSATITHNAH